MKFNWYFCQWPWEINYDKYLYEKMVVFECIYLQHCRIFEPFSTIQTSDMRAITYEKHDSRYFSCEEACYRMMQDTEDNFRYLFFSGNKRTLHNNLN